MLKDYLKSKLNEKGWAVYHLFRVSNVSTSYINSILAEKSKKPSVEILKKLAKAFGDEPEVWMEKAGYLSPSNTDLSSFDEDIEKKVNEVLLTLKDLEKNKQELALEMMHTLVKGLK